MSDLAGLRKGDRSRVVRRPVKPEDGIEAAQKETGGGFAAQLFVAAYAGILTGLFLFGFVAALSWVTGFAADPVMIGALCLGAGIAVSAATIFRPRPSRAAAATRKQDFASGEVDELILDVAEAKAFREPEHGGLMYFLKLADGRVFFDVPGSALPEDGWESRVHIIPEAELPRARLHLLYGTESGRLLATRYSGMAVHPVSIRMMKGNPDYWPAEGTFRKTAWSEIEAHFAAR